MILNKNIAISESGIIFDPSTGETFVVNQMGMKIINLIKKNHNYIEIKKQLEEQYSVDGDEIEKDIKSFIDFMLRYNLIKKEL